LDEEADCKEPDDNEEEDLYEARTSTNSKGSNTGGTNDEANDVIDLDVDVEKVFLFLRSFTLVL
jgi:hypothetical protein